eukprot:6183834-Pleurochrysis_carterae.AAC.4
MISSIFARRALWRSVATAASLFCAACARASSFSSDEKRLVTALTADAKSANLVSKPSAMAAELSGGATDGARAAEISLWGDCMLSHCGAALLAALSLAAFS